MVAHGGRLDIYVVWATATFAGNSTEPWVAEHSRQTLRLQAWSTESCVGFGVAFGMVNQTRPCEGRFAGNLGVPSAHGVGPIGTCIAKLSPKPLLNLEAHPWAGFGSDFRNAEGLPRPAPTGLKPLAGLGATLPRPCYWGAGSKKQNTAAAGHFRFVRGW